MSERRPVIGWEGIYNVSEDGKVFRVARGKNTFVGRELKPYLSNHGYLLVRLYSQNQPRAYLVHRLVTTAFLENPENLPQVNHKDCNKQNNHVSNLEWCTQEYNIQHAVENGRHEKHYQQMAMKQSKSVIGTHLVTGEQIEFSSAREAGRNGFNQGNISSCCRNLLKHHKGYSWKFKVIRKSFVVPHNL